MIFSVLVKDTAQLLMVAGIGIAGVGAMTTFYKYILIAFVLGCFVGGGLTLLMAKQENARLQIAVAGLQTTLVIANSP